MRRAVKRLLNNNGGTMVLESALLLPAYLVMLLFLVSLVKLSIVYSFAGELAYNTAEYTARAINVLDRAYYYLAEEHSDVEAFRQFFEAAKSEFKDNSLGEFFSHLSEGGGEIKDDGAELIMVKPRLNEFKDHILFRKDSIKILRTSLADKMVEVVIQYKTTIPVPFARKEFLIASRGYERQWIGKW